MNKLFIIRWPTNPKAAYVNGATIRYFQNKNVYYANEVLSPGQVICSWYSETDYMGSGLLPTLPLLSAGKKYQLSLRLKSDNVMPVQISLKFLDSNKNVIAVNRSTDMHFDFTVPTATVTYQIELINLNHKWLLFDYLIIQESLAVEDISTAAYLKPHYDLVHVTQSDNQAIEIVVNAGPKTIIPIDVDSQKKTDQIYMFTDGSDIDKMMRHLHYIFAHQSYSQSMIVPGIGFYTLSDSVRSIINNRSQMTM